MGEPQYNDMLKHCKFSQVNETNEIKEGYFECDCVFEQRALLKIFKRNLFFGIWSYYKPGEHLHITFSNNLELVPREIEVGNTSYFPYGIFMNEHKWHIVVTYSKPGKINQFRYLISKPGLESEKKFWEYQYYCQNDQITPKKYFGDFELAK